MSAKTYHSMIAGSRFEFKNGKTVFFVGEKGQNGTYSTDDEDEIAELDKLSKSHGSGISESDVPTLKQATSGIAAEITKQTGESKAAELKAAAAGLGGGGKVVGA